MFKRLLTLSLTLALTFALAGLAPAAEKTYINGIDASYPPHAFIDKDGQATGFDVDAMDWIANKMGFKVKHEAMDWSSIVTSLLNKRIDMICSGMSISPERQAVVTFSDPYFSIRKYLVVHEDSNLTKDEILGGEKRLGVQSGTNEALWLEENKAPNKWNYTLRFYASPPMAIEDVVNKRIDAAAIDSAPANDAINKGKKPIKVVGEFAEGDDFGVATRNEDVELREMINEGFRQLQADPYWEELKAKYGI